MLNETHNVKVAVLIHISDQTFTQCWMETFKHGKYGRFDFIIP